MRLLNNDLCPIPFNPNFYLHLEALVCSQRCAGNLRWLKLLLNLEVLQPLSRNAAFLFFSLQIKILSFSALKEAAKHLTEWVMLCDRLNIHIFEAFCSCDHLDRSPFVSVVIQVADMFSEWLRYCTELLKEIKRRIFARRHYYCDRGAGLLFH